MWLNVAFNDGKKPVRRAAKSSADNGVQALRSRWLAHALLQAIVYRWWARLAIRSPSKGRCDQFAAPARRRTASAWAWPALVRRSAIAAAPPGEGRGGTRGVVSDACNERAGISPGVQAHRASTAMRTGLATSPPRRLST